MGLPATAGFFGKFYIFKAAVNSNLIWLAVLMAINSVIGAYYYLRLIVAMYMREPKPELTPPAVVPFPLSISVVVGLTALGAVYFGLFPNHVLSHILLQSRLIAH